MQKYVIAIALLVLPVVAIAAPPLVPLPVAEPLPAQAAPTLTPDDIASIMKFMARVQMQGSEAPEFMAAVGKLRAFMPQPGTTKP